MNMYDPRTDYLYHPSIIKSILAANPVKLLMKTLKRLGLQSSGRKDELLARLGDYLSTREGKQMASRRKISR